VKPRGLLGRKLPIQYEGIPVQLRTRAPTLSYVIVNDCTPCSREGIGIAHPWREVVDDSVLDTRSQALVAVPQDQRDFCFAHPKVLNTKKMERRPSASPLIYLAYVDGSRVHPFG
jgi:hypothetical protein